MANAPVVGRGRQTFTIHGCLSKYAALLLIEGPVLSNFLSGHGGNLTKFHLLPLETHIYAKLLQDHADTHLVPTERVRRLYGRLNAKDEEIIPMHHSPDIIKWMMHASWIGTTPSPASALQHPQWDCQM
eukprot:2321481-Amphidinium_carterae.2